MINRLFALTLGLVAAFTLAACENTIRGAGRDVQETAGAIEDVAQ